MTQINLVNTGINDFTAIYELNANASYKLEISEAASVSIEVLWGSFTYAGATVGVNIDATDATAMLKVSQDGTNTQNHPTASSITLNAATGVSGWQTDKWTDKWLHVDLTKNSNTSGTVRLLVTIK